MRENQNSNHENGSANRDLVPVTDNIPSTELREAADGYPLEEEIHLRDYLDVILRRKWLIFNFLVLTVLSTLILTLATPKIYKASTTIQAEAANQNITNFEELVSVDIRSREFLGTQTELLQNESLARRVIEKLDLLNHPVIADTLWGSGELVTISQIKGMLKDWARQFISALGAKAKDNEADESEIAEDVLKLRQLLVFFADNLEVSPNRNSMLIDISFTSPNRHLSKNIVNALAEEFILWKMEQRLDASQLARDFLMKQIDQAKINLEKSEEELNQFAKQAGIVSLDSKLNVVYRQLEELNSALAQTEAELIAKEAVYRQAKMDGSQYLPQVLESKIISDLKSEYARLRSEYEELTTTFHGDYPKVKPLKTRMLSLASRIEAEEDKIFRAIKNDYLAALQKAKTLLARVDRQNKLALDLNERSTQYRIMERQTETNKGIYDSLLQRVREIESMVGVASSDIQIVDPATLPIDAFKPKVKQNFLLAVFVGLFAGIGCAFFLEYFSDKISNPDELTDRFQLPVLGVVPLIKSGDRPIEETIIDDPRSPFAEAMRTIMISLQLSGFGNRSKSVLITSSMPAEGKTTLAVNLALTFAGAGEKVILVDADLRKPRIHQILASADGNSRQGLSSYLAGIDEDCHISRNGHANLCFVPAGMLPPNPVELLTSGRLAQLMDSLGREYDRIIIDGPPMLGLADMIVLSRYVGGVVLVSSMGETTRRAVRHFKQCMANVHANVLGSIMNKVDISRRYGYASYYNQSAYYNSDYLENQEKSRGGLLRKN